MGQYHYCVNLDRHEFLDPQKLGDGLKLWEQINGHGGVAAALLVLCAASNGRGGGDLQHDPHSVIGRWAGDRIAVVGDYAEDGDLPAEHHAGSIVFQLFSAMKGEQNGWTDISTLVVPVLREECI